MLLPLIVEQYLKRHHIVAEKHTHQPAFTARQLADIQHVPESCVAKVVFFLADERMGMAVLPANRHLNLHLLRRHLEAEAVRLATEAEIARHVVSVELGAVPPFGTIFGMPVFLDESLMESRCIEVAGGTHTESIKIRLGDFIREEAPQVALLSRGPIRPKAEKPVHRHGDLA